MIASPKEKECIEFAIKLKIRVEQERKANEEKNLPFFLKLIRRFRKVENTVTEVEAPVITHYRVGTKKTLSELWELYGFYGDHLAQAECLTCWILTLYGVEYDVEYCMQKDLEAIRDHQRRLKQEGRKLRVNYGTTVGRFLWEIDNELGSYTA